ncbi:uncharacterized protein LOC113855720 [Abrus precatorius]|uniref:Uncharacterized protein LOC113855720 n=1 Tax=Abrus precatorius TaxID=3816 RepID=A0A8B8KH59_ABRPR|nr:uncharacterized protein LOC113855720 [Abrus precatorius]
MEGLLPLVYRAIKKHKTRRKYQCLSSGAAISYNMNMSEFYPQIQGHGLQEPSIQKVVDDGADNIGYRRYNSVRDFSNNGFSSPQRRSIAAGSPTSKQLSGFTLFSCVTRV